MESAEEQKDQVTPALLSCGMSYLSAILFALFLVLAWLPNSLGMQSVFFGWLAVLCLVLYRYAEPPRYMPMYIAGIICHIGGFYWLFHTIKDFGGFGAIPAGALFGLYAAVSALQFLVFVFLLRSVPTWVHKSGLATALAWVVSNILIPQIFPWSIAHTQLDFTHFIQIADLGGVPLITFVMIWGVEGAYLLFTHRRFQLVPLLSIFALCASIWYSTQVISESTPSGKIAGPLQKVAVIQGNISLTEKHDPLNRLVNFERYLELSKNVGDSETLVVWPETALTEWIPDGIFSKKQNEILTRLSDNVPFLFGTLTFESEERFYNSAIAVTGSGEIPSPYHKQILMPFGEYTPGAGKSKLSQFLPEGVQHWLQEMNATASDFTAGSGSVVFNIPIKRSASQGVNGTLAVSPLICYEDIVPELSRDAVKNGAQLLVNLTNDAWFGRSVAPLQHHRIAAFRAVENKRYLVRATNSGFTAVVDPLGRTISHLAPFTEGTLLAEVSLISYNSVYTTYNGAQLWWWVALVTLALAVIARAHLAYRSCIAAREPK